MAAHVVTGNVRGDGDGGGHRELGQKVGVGGSQVKGERTGELVGRDSPGEIAPSSGSAAFGTIDTGVVLRRICSWAQLEQALNGTPKIRRLHKLPVRVVEVEEEVERVRLYVVVRGCKRDVQHLSDVV